MKISILAALSASALFAQTPAATISVSTTSTTTIQSSAGGSCTISNKVAGNGSFSWTCGASPTATPSQSGTFTQTAGQADLLMFSVSDLFCMVDVNATATAMGVAPEINTSTPTVTIPANSIGLMCTSKSAGGISNAIVP